MMNDAPRRPRLSRPPTSPLRSVCLAAWWTLLGAGCLAGDGPPEAGPGGLDAGALDGARLYVDKGCAGCHGPLASSTKRNATFERIRGAAGPMGRVPQMQGLSLTDEEIRALVTALADGGYVTDRRATLVQPLLLTQRQLMSRFARIFVPRSDGQVDPDWVFETLEVTFAGRANVLGGHCGLYDGCEAAEVRATQNPAPSPLRAGIILRACAELLALDGMTAAVASNAGLDPRARLDGAALDALWDLFRPGWPLDGEARGALLDLADAGRAAGLSELRLHTLVLHQLCRPAVLETL